MQQSQENNRRLLREALPNLAPGYGDSAHDKAAERLARDTEPGFTPGPYHCNAIARGRVVGDETARAERYEICNRNAGVATVYRPKDVPLFKAAPDLYAALGAIESYLTSHLVIGKNGKASTEVANMLDAARAALARAKGGAA